MLIFGIIVFVTIGAHFVICYFVAGIWTMIAEIEYEGKTCVWCFAEAIISGSNYKKITNKQCAGGVNRKFIEKHKHSIRRLQRWHFDLIVKALKSQFQQLSTITTNNLFHNDHSETWSLNWQFSHLTKYRPGRCARRSRAAGLLASSPRCSRRTTTDPTTQTACNTISPQWIILLLDTLNFPI